MPTLSCPKCETRLSIKDPSKKKAKCPKCNTVFACPPPPTEDSGKKKVSSEGTKAVEGATSPMLSRRKLAIFGLAGACIVLIVCVIAIAATSFFLGRHPLTPIGTYERSHVKQVLGKKAILVFFKCNDRSQGGVGPWEQEDHYIIDESGKKHFAQAIGLRTNEWKRMIYEQPKKAMPKPEIADGNSWYHTTSFPMVISAEGLSTEPKTVTLLFNTVDGDSRNLRLGYKGSDKSINVGIE